MKTREHQYMKIMFNYLFWRKLFLKHAMTVLTMTETALLTALTLTAQASLVQWGRFASLQEKQHAMTVLTMTVTVFTTRIPSTRIVNIRSNSAVLTELEQRMRNVR